MLLKERLEYTMLVQVVDAVVINEAGSDRDTRIEGASDAKLFKVDASPDRVGVGTN